MQFFISHLAKWLRTRRFSEPTFRPSGATNHLKNAMNRIFSTFTCIFFPLALSLLWSSLFSSLTLSTSAFPLIHAVGSLTSKLFGQVFLHPNIPFYPNHRSPSPPSLQFTRKDFNFTGGSSEAKRSGMKTVSGSSFTVKAWAKASGIFWTCKRDRCASVVVFVEGEQAAFTITIKDLTIKHLDLTGTKHQRLRIYIQIYIYI